MVAGPRSGRRFGPRQEVGDGRVWINEHPLAGLNVGGQPANEFGAAGIGADAANRRINSFGIGTLDDGAQHENSGNSANRQDRPPGTLEKSGGHRIEERHGEDQMPNVEARGNAGDQR